MFENILFLSSALLTLAGALGVVFTKNLMHACVLLLATLFGVSGLYAVLGADFLAAAQLVVYAGGVIILMLFAVMLTGGTANNDNKFGIEKVAAMGSIKTYIYAGLTVLVMSFTILKILANYMKTFEQGELAPLESTVEKIGTLLVTDHVLAFEISSILLLGALVGAAVIARPRRG
jgi:NADH:ubiquinone oxidoreductase subunit 6 (subunit J)